MYRVWMLTGVCLLGVGCAADGERASFGTLQSDPDRTAGQVRKGIDVVVMDVSWDRLEPMPGKVDATYVAELRDRLERFRQAGARVCLDLGMQYPPRWVFDLPHSRYVDQFRRAYADSGPGMDMPNAVFNQQVRDTQQRHVAHVFDALGTDFFAVRLGWGQYGELCYPRPRYADKLNCFWGYDAIAQGLAPGLAEGVERCPTPGWTIGSPSEDHAPARAFAQWYLDSLAQYQNWQIAVVRRQFAGRLMVLYPSWGLRPGVIESLIARDLDSETQEIQRGLDYARLIASVTDPKVIVYGTWMDGNSPYVDDGSADPRDWSPVHYLAHLAHTHRPALDVWAENTGPGTRDAMALCFERLHRFGIVGLVWAFEPDLYSGAPGNATLAEYAEHVERVCQAQPCRTNASTP